jgi:hypothetical protein
VISDRTPSIHSSPPPLSSSLLPFPPLILSLPSLHPLSPLPSMPRTPPPASAHTRMFVQYCLVLTVHPHLYRTLYCTILYFTILDCTVLYVLCALCCVLSEAYPQQELFTRDTPVAFTFCIRVNSSAMVGWMPTVSRRSCNYVRHGDEYKRVKWEVEREQRRERKRAREREKRERNRE